MALFTSIIQNIAKGMVARRLIGGGQGTKGMSAQDYLSDIVAEKIITLQTAPMLEKLF